MTSAIPHRLHIVKKLTPEAEEIFTPEALEFLKALCTEFMPQAETLLERRVQRQREINRGELPDFLPDTAAIRQGDWKVNPIPADLQDRRVEITGPVDRKMIINALNSGAKVFMADFEDAHSPTWDGTVAGQINLRDAVLGTIEYLNIYRKSYKLNEKTATLIVRPRGWHLKERHILYNGVPIPGALMDFGLFFFHNAKALLAKGSGPYFYLPKLESHLEARLWNNIFNFAQAYLKLPRGTIKATVLIETILAAFEMDEILYELREHIVALNCGRWDYIFSFIKKFHKNPDWVMPERGQITMTSHFLQSYSLLLIQTCHKRGALAMGGMAPQIPIKNNPEANEQALAKVRADKEREASNGHDGTWVAHPALVPVAMEVFDRIMPTANQLHVLREDVKVTAKDLLTLPEGTITEAGLRNNIAVAIQYIEAWIRGIGCVPIYNLMEDAATAEICRTQIWQWLRYPKGVLDDGRKVTEELFRALMGEELLKIEKELKKEEFVLGYYMEAVEILERLVLSEEFTEFLTLPAMEYLRE